MQKQIQTMTNIRNRVIQNDENIVFIWIAKKRRFARNRKIARCMNDQFHHNIFIFFVRRIHEYKFSNFVFFNFWFNLYSTNENLKKIHFEFNRCRKNTFFDHAIKKYIIFFSIAILQNHFCFLKIFHSIFFTNFHKILLHREKNTQTKQFIKTNWNYKIHQKYSKNKNLNSLRNL